MNIFNLLKLGEGYSKNDLATLLNEGSLNTVREGVFSCRNSKSYFLFVDLHKAGKVDRFHFNDYFEEDFFHWDSQTTQHINSPKIQEVVQGSVETHLFVRVFQKIKGKTQPFLYCGRLKYVEHDHTTSKPVHILFNSIDYDDFSDNEALKIIYRWTPEKSGVASSVNLDKKQVISSRRKNNYRPPNSTERQGLVTSRVGQGYFRNQLIDKFDNKCAVTQSQLHKILIASHIVPWSESTDEERLDVNNGLLLSPLYDALFDKHLISFDISGKIMLSSLLETEIKNLNIDINSSIKVDNQMEFYLKRHRARLE